MAANEKNAVKDETISLLTLTLTPGIGPVQAQRLLDAYGTAEKTLINLRGGYLHPSITDIKQSTMKALLSRGIRGKAREVWEWCDKDGVKISGLTLPHYPERLRFLPEKPVILFCRGDLSLLNHLKCAALIGCRTPTPYGRATAEEFAAGLAARGICVVSGMARGIDTHAHVAALRAEGKTIAVLATGLDRIYPPESVNLAGVIASKGLLLSEMPPKTPLVPGHFPRRNRIISGLGDLIVIVEAGLRSGALITAKWALDQGKEIAAVPGPIHAPMSMGPLALISDGAAIADSLETLAFLLGISEKKRKETKSNEASPPMEEESFLDALAGAGGNTDTAALILGIPPSKALRLATRLEIEGKLVRRNSALYFQP